jgi:Skp family chaperone for outer membrane proteins
MNRIVLGALAALLVGSLTATAVLSQDRPAPTRLGFVDVRKAFESYRKKKDVEEQLKARTDALEQRFRQESARIEQAAEKLNTLNEGSEERAQLDRQISIDRSTLDMDKKYEARRLQREARRKEALIYKEISQEAQALGQERGLAAVFLHVPLEADFETKGDLDIFMGTRAVLCRDDSLDVTAELVQRLNALLPPAPTPPK